MRVRAYVADFLSMLDQLQRHAEVLDELCLQAVAVDLYLRRKPSGGGCALAAAPTV
jgi:hypothetical protein